MSEASEITDAGGSLLKPGRNCWKVTRADNVRLIIDADNYFRDLKAAFETAQEQIILIGWDFDSRVSLDGGDGKQPLGQFVWGLTKRNPKLKVYILNWNLHSMQAFFRGRMFFTLIKWMASSRIRIKFDNAHPAGACHHQKLIVIDNQLAFCGGIDVSHSRWDTRDHHGTNPSRRNPDGKTYDPWHDISLAVDGETAQALHELARDRWHRATGKRLDTPSVTTDWPYEDAATFTDVEVAIARTRGEYKEYPAVRENEALFIDAIASARKFIYAENQYFASKLIAAAIAKRLNESDPPEVVIVMPETADGWLEQMAMDSARAQLVALIRKADTHKRFRIYHPVADDGTPIYVHAKLTIVDDRLLKVGSSNMNNRSLGFDSECDLALEPMSGATESESEAMTSIRTSLLAEHLGAQPEAVADMLKSKSMIETIESLRGTGHTLQPFVMEETSELSDIIANENLLDPLEDDEGSTFEKIGKTERWWNKLKRSG